MNRKIIVISFLLACAAPVMAAHHGEERPYLTASQSLSTSAEVVSVDMETRKVELRTDNGLVLSYKVAETAPNLDQLEVGDVVDYSFESRTSLILVGPNDALPEVVKEVSQTRAEPGEMPRLTTESKRVLTARVVSIDLESSAFQLEWADGSVEDYTTDETEMLKKASVGDHLVKTQTERLVLSVSRPGTD